VKLFPLISRLGRRWHISTGGLINYLAK